MRLVFRVLVCLYPRRWRTRYGAELEGLIQEAGVGWTDAFDVLRGAMEMQMTNWTFGRIVASFAVAGALVGGAASLGMPTNYVSKAVLEMPAGGADRAGSREPVTAFRRTLNQEALRRVIEGQRLYERERRESGMDGVIETMRHHIRVTRLNGGSLIEISFASRDAREAQRTNQELVAKLTGELGGFAVIDSASLPEGPSRPDYGAAIGLGLVGGLVLGTATAVWRRVGATAAS